jgi:hypothetical protein
MSGFHPEQILGDASRSRRRTFCRLVLLLICVPSLRISHFVRTEP